MKRLFSLLAALSIAVSTPLTVLSAEEQGDKPARLEMEAKATISTVQEIDQETRKVTLRDAEGNMTTFTAGPEVRNLAQVNKGDIVLMEYYQGFAYVVEPATAAVRSRIDTTGVARADAGEKPGASITDTVDVIAAVEAIDAETRMVTLKGAQRTVTLKAADDVDLRLGESACAVIGDRADGDDLELGVDLDRGDRIAGAGADERLLPVVAAARLRQRW